MYSGYTEFIKNINIDNITYSNFKNNPKYNGILEHVSFELGNEYLNFIEKEFSEITTEQIIEYLRINDKFGNPKMFEFNIKNEQKVMCSPTSIRYIYHALLILKYYKKSNLTQIIELGCGYGGLFLAVCYFSKILNVNIDKYYFVDLPEVCNLIQCYLLINNSNININYVIHHSNTFGKNIPNENLFFISNYCFTEIDEEYRKEYIENLIPKCKNGFIVWQTCSGYDINLSYRLFDKLLIEEERPQTAINLPKNYFVYFEK
jgi:hypothetical protein